MDPRFADYVGVGHVALHSLRKVLQHLGRDQTVVPCTLRLNHHALLPVSIGSSFSPPPKTYYIERSMKFIVANRGIQHAVLIDWIVFLFGGDTEKFTFLILAGFGLSYKQDPGAHSFEELYSKMLDADFRIGEDGPRRSISRIESGQLSGRAVAAYGF